MKTYHITCEEINTFTVEVEAENEEQALELVNENVNKHEVVYESVSEWSVDDITEVYDSGTTYTLMPLMGHFSCII